MKSSLFVSMAFGMLLQTGLAAAQSDMRAVAERPSVEVQGSAEILVDPDHAILRIAVRHNDATLLGARGRNQAAVARLLAEAGTLGVPAADLASTPSMAFRGRWDCTTCTDAEKESGYSARSSVTITLRKMDVLGDLVTRLDNDANLQLEDVEYRTTGLRQHRDRARASAMRAAREKAVALAGEIGQSIGKALTIKEASQANDGFWSWSQWGYSCCGYYSSSSRFESRSMAQNVMLSEPSGGSADDVGSLAPGRIAVRAGVSVAFELL